MIIARHDVILEPGAVIKFWKSLQFGDHCTVQANAYIYGSRSGQSVSFGDYVVISHGCMLLGEGGLSIGSYTHLGPGVTVTTQFGDSRTDPCVPDPGGAACAGHDRRRLLDRHRGGDHARCATWRPLHRRAELGGVSGRWPDGSQLSTTASLPPVLSANSAPARPGAARGHRRRGMTTVVISQPMYFPWPGFFELIAAADVYVHLDDVQFSKGGFTNRIQLKTVQGKRLDVGSAGRQGRFPGDPPACAQRYRLRAPPPRPTPARAQGRAAPRRGVGGLRCRGDRSGLGRGVGGLDRTAGRPTRPVRNAAAGCAAATSTFPAAPASACSTSCAPSVGPGT